MTRYSEEELDKGCSETLAACESCGAIYYVDGMGCRCSTSKKIDSKWLSRGKISGLCRGYVMDDQ